MKRFPLTLPLGVREAPSDFLSRLASRNCTRDMRMLARDFAINVQDVINGKEQQLVLLAEASGADLGALQTEAFSCANRSNAIFYRGHKLSRTIQLSRDVVRVCPACVREDLQAHSFRLEARPYRRAHWKLSTIRTCERHDLSLVSLGGMAAACESLDTSLVIARTLPFLSRFEASAVSRPPTALERYVLDRLDSVSDGGWMDSLKLHVVMQASALLGASMTRGNQILLSSLSDEERLESDAIGFDAMAAGESGIRSALEAIDTQKTGENAKGPTAMFGQVYGWLANANSDPDFDPIREIIAGHIIDTMPVGLGDKLFKKDIPIRKIHSVWSASRQYRMDRDRLRLMLIEGGWIDAAAELPFNWMTFDAVASEPFLKDAKSSLNYLQALKYLNAPKSHEPILVASGLLKPWIPAGASGLKDHAFLARDLDAFLKRLMEHADERYSADPAFMTISSAQKRVFCGAEAILRLILDDRLKRVGKRIGVEGYNSVLVDPREVERLVVKKDKDALSTKEVAHLLRMPQDAVLGLIANGMLPAVDRPHPKTRRLMKIVSRSAVDEFSRTYVSFAEAARSAQMSLSRFRSERTRKGVKPAFDDGVVVYRRIELAAVDP